MTKSNKSSGIGVIIAILVVILIAGILFIGKPWLSPPLQNCSSCTCPSGQECRLINDTPFSKENLTTAQKKLSTDILQLTDSRYLPTGLTHEALELQMEQNHQVTHVAETGNTLVYVYIKTSKNTDTATINAFVWNVTDTDPVNHLVVAWMDVNNINQLASFDFVESIESVTPPLSWRR
jgi:hypothetical protein